MSKYHRFLCAIFVGAFALLNSHVSAQVTANSLAELRAFGLSVNNTTVTLSSTGGDPHPVTGITTPGHYWINGDHISDPTNSMPIFMDLNGTGNTFVLTGTTINLDTRKLDGFGRNLGHDSGVDIVQINGSNNTVQDITLIGQDIALGTDPNAQRYADWATQYIELSGVNNTVDGANVVTRGSRTDSYGLGDAFGKGSSQGISPYLGHRKASAFRVGEATNAVANDIHLDVNTFGHGFFVQASTDTTLTNSTITGELFPSQGIIDHPLYQQYGVTYHQNPIPNDLMISGAEDGVRMYTGASGLTVDSVVVTNMRSGFATSLGGSTTTLNNVEAYGVETAFDVGTFATITNAKADGVNGPVIVVDRNIRRDSTIEIELVGNQPFNHDYALAYVSGDRLDVNISSNRPAVDFENTTLFRTSQFFYENWRETNDTTTHDVADYDQVNSVLINDTNQLLILGDLATNNVGRSQGGVISNGKENYYDGVTIVPAGSLLQVVHDNGLGNSGTETGAEFDNSYNVVYTGTPTPTTLDDNATVVASGATLELAPGIRIQNEKLTISGFGFGGSGALYSDGEVGNGTRFGSSSNSDQSTVILDGDSAIGVGIAGNQMLVGRIQGTGDLTKLGPGTLSVEKSATYDGDLIVAAGRIVARSGVANHGLTVASGASMAGIGNNSFNTSEMAVINGTMDLNSRSDTVSLTGKVGGLTGSGIVEASNLNASAPSELSIGAPSLLAIFSGQIQGKVSLVKTGNSLQVLTGNNTYTGTTTISDGFFFVDGTHTGGDAYTVESSAVLGGEGEIDATVVVNAGGVLAPGSVSREFTIQDVQLQANSMLEIELAGNVAGNNHDLLTVNSVILGGNLSVSLGGGFSPYASDTFTIVSASSLTGAFGNVASGSRMDTVGGGGSFQVTYDSTIDQVVLANFLPSKLLGDFNGNGIVDAADYTVWRDDFGLTGITPFSGADANGDGSINVDDYIVWTNNFGTVQSNVAALVPEPTGLMHLAALLVFLCFARRMPLAHSFRRREV